jgi:hypothetical protein
MFLPIQFNTKIKKEEFGDLCSSKILDLIENYLVEENFSYITRKDNKIFFHVLHIYLWFDVKSFLVSGTVRVKNKNGNLTITNGNWMVFLIAVPFVILFLIANTKFSTFGKTDFEMIWWFMITIFGGNLIFRFFAHLNFKETIKKLIIKNKAQLLV